TYHLPDLVRRMVTVLMVPRISRLHRTLMGPQPRMCNRPSVNFHEVCLNVILEECSRPLNFGNPPPAKNRWNALSSLSTTSCRACASTSWYCGISRLSSGSSSIWSYFVMRRCFSSATFRCSRQALYRQRHRSSQCSSVSACLGFGYRRYLNVFRTSPPPFAPFLGFDVPLYQFQGSTAYHCHEV